MDLPASHASKEPPRMTLALIELRRAKLRFGLLAGAVALLVFLVLFLATLGRTLLGFSTGALANSSADALVYNPAAHRNLQASRLDPSVAGRVAAVAGVAAAAGVGQTTITADAGRGPVTLTLFGIQPGQPGTPAKLIGGRLPGPGEALVDRADAASGFRIGREVTLQPGGRRDPGRGADRHDLRPAHRHRLCDHRPGGRLLLPDPDGAEAARAAGAARAGRCHRLAGSLAAGPDRHPGRRRGRARHRRAGGGRGQLRSVVSDRRGPGSGR